VKCDKCKAHEATVHDVTIRGGKRVERHLCANCAKEEGYQVQALLGPQQVVQAIVAQPVTECCPLCGMKFGSFRQSGLLGCPECYSAFSGQLSAPLERWHEGGTHHVGKVPRRARAAPAPHAERAPESTSESAAALAALEMLRRRVDTLRRQLCEAVEGEQYERAAALRDEINRLESVSLGENLADPPPAPRPREPRSE
jgi:protein arginine kinase activator